MSSRDPHASCLGLEHGRQAVHGTGACPHCAFFLPQCPCRQLSRILSLLRSGPDLPSTASGTAEVGDLVFTSLLAKASWSSQLDLREAQEVEVMEVEPQEDKAPPLDSLTSVEDEEDPVILPAEAEQLLPASAILVTVESSGAKPAPPLAPRHV